MAVSEQQVRTLLGELARGPQPASAIDVGRAARDGRRRRRTRLFVECGAAVAAVGLVAGGVSLAGRDTPRPVAVAAPERFDPLTLYADFGWLPSRLGERSVWIQPDRMVLEAAPPGAEPTVGAVPRVAVVLYPIGVRPPANVVADLPWPLAGGCQAGQGTTAPRVGGRPAEWTYPRAAAGSRCDPTAVELRWQYAPGAWAVARTSDLPRTPDGDPRSVARRVAETLRAGVDEPLRLPYRAGFVPRGLGVAGSVEYGVPGTKRWQVAVTLRQPEQQGRAARKPREASIAVMPAGARFPIAGSEPFDTTVDGHRAYRRSVPNDMGVTEILRVTGVRGLEFRITTSNAGRTAPEQILRGLTVTGGKPADWTSRPFG